MPESVFEFKQFRLQQTNAAMKLGIDSMILGSWSDPVDSKNVLDIGAGTGVLSLMLAQRSNASIVAVEIDDQACIDARINFRNSPWFDRLDLVQTSIQDFAEIAKPDSFDLIICNPPYFEKSVKSTNSNRNLARHNDGLPDEVLLRLVQKLLLPGGRFALILPASRAIQFVSMAEKFRLYTQRLLSIRPRSGKSENRRIMEFCKQSGPCFEESLIVYEEMYYTKDYIELTRDYYSKDLSIRTLI